MSGSEQSYSKDLELVDLYPPVFRESELGYADPEWMDEELATRLVSVMLRRVMPS